LLEIFEHKVILYSQPDFLSACQGSNPKTT